PTALTYCTHPRLNSVSNTLCGHCADGYLQWSESCVVCDSANGAIIFAIVVCSLLLVVFLLWSSSSASASGGPMAILLYFVQTASLEIGGLMHSLAWL